MLSDVYRENEALERRHVHDMLRLGQVTAGSECMVE